MQIVKSEFSLVLADGTQKCVVADNMFDVTTEYDSPALPMVQCTRTKVGIQVVDIASTDVPFVTLVTPSGAGTAGCLALPNAFAVVDGAYVVFQAVTVVGFNFVGWYLAGVLQSSSLIAKLRVNAPAIAGQTVQFEARFAAV